MELIADIFLATGAMGAGFYCFVLARRLDRFNDLEKGVCGAVAVLSAQVDELSRTLVAARTASDGSGAALDELTNKAEEVAHRLELLMAAMHDLPDSETDPEHTFQKDEAPKPPRQRTANGPMFVRHGKTQGGAVQ